MRRLILLTLLSVATLFACSSNTPKSAPIKAFSGELPAAPAWLAARQPDNALAYIRWPYFLGMTSAPKGNNLDRLMASDAHVTLLNELLAGLGTNVAASPGLDVPAVQWLLRHQRSAVEVSVGPIPGIANNAPAMLLTVRTSLPDAETAAIAVTELAASMIPGGGLPEGFDDNGVAEIAGTPMPVIAAFDDRERRLFILAGAGATTERMVKAREALEKTTASPPMADLESMIDASRHGFFAWMSVGNAMKIGQMFIPANIFETINNLGLDTAESIAVGYGVSRGKARLTLLADIPNDGGYRSLIPVPDNALALKTTEAPRFLAAASLPSVEELKAILDATGEDAQKIQEGIDELTDMLGADPFDLYGLLAGEILYVGEGVGSYGAFGGIDAKKMDAVIGAIGDKHQLPIEVRRIDGLDIRYWKLPSLVAMATAEEKQGALSGETAAASLMALYARIGSHLFWTYEDGYAIFASAPQTLVDRHRRGAKLSVGRWLEDTQKQDFRRVPLGLSVSAEGLPRFAHQTYLASVPLLSDIADINLDIWSIPTADDLGLADRGTLGLSVITDERLLGFEFTMEHSLADTFGGGSTIAGVTAIGILAAIAIPAYQDYTIRAQVAEAITVAYSTKLEVTAFYIQYGRFPNSQETEDFFRETNGRYANTIEVEADTGTILVAIDGEDANELIYGDQLFLTPVVNAVGGFDWACSGEMDNKFLPAACRE